MAGVSNMFPGKEVIYTLSDIEWDDGEPTGEEKLLYIGTDYERSREIKGSIDDYAEIKHRVYVDSELMFEAKMDYSTNGAWVSTYDLIDKLEAEVEEAKQRLADLTGKLASLGQR